MQLQEDHQRRIGLLAQLLGSFKQLQGGGGALRLKRPWSGPATRRRASCAPAAVIVDNDCERQNPQKKSSPVPQ